MDGPQPGKYRPESRSNTPASYLLYWWATDQERCSSKRAFNKASFPLRLFNFLPELNALSNNCNRLSPCKRIGGSKIILDLQNLIANGGIQFVYCQINNGFVPLYKLRSMSNHVFLKDRDYLLLPRQCRPYFLLHRVK